MLRICSLAALVVTLAHFNCHFGYPWYKLTINLVQHMLRICFEFGLRFVPLPEKWGAINFLYKILSNLEYMYLVARTMEIISCYFWTYWMGPSGWFWTRKWMVCHWGKWWCLFPLVFSFTRRSFKSHSKLFMFGYYCWIEFHVGLLCSFFLLFLY